MKFFAICFALMLIGLPTAGFAEDSACKVPDQDDCSAGPRAFYICHADQTYFGPRNQWKALEGGSTIRVPSGKTKIVVLGTNTALFEYKLSSEPVESPEGKQLNAFLKAFGPYFVDVPTAEIEGRARTLEPKVPALTNVPALAAPLSQLKDALATLDRDIDSLRSFRIGLLQAFAAEEAEALSSRVQRLCGADTVDQARALCAKSFQEKADALIADYERIQELLSKVTAPLATAETEVSKQRQFSQQEDTATMLRALEANLAKASELTKSARKALDDASDVLARVRELERLTIDGLEAKGMWCSPPLPISLEKGRKVTLKIARKPVAAVASAGRLPDVDTVFTLQPQWAIRPAVGLSLFYAADAVYPTFGTSKTKVTEDGKEVERFRIIEKELEDHRFTYGLTLALTNRRFCTGDGTSCGWLDLTVNPSDDVKAIGAGLAWNWHRFRLGAGALWTKHATLENDLAVDDLLAAEGDLKTGTTYDDPQFYVAFSVIGWRPFVAE